MSIIALRVAQRRSTSGRSCSECPVPPRHDRRRGAWSVPATRILARSRSARASTPSSYGADPIGSAAASGQAGRGEIGARAEAGPRFGRQYDQPPGDKPKCRSLHSEERNSLPGQMVMEFAVAGYWTRAKWDVADLKTLLQCDVGLVANGNAENDHTEPRRRMCACLLYGHLCQTNLAKKARQHSRSHSLQAQTSG